ncbi:MAG: serine/threonine-protein kinase [Leptolyngbyaceae cyanobacterium bins.59]|nr:serine/threonine-protein kinase [Leptolyngbyaceae cyanobacterium bins.59]
MLQPEQVLQGRYQLQRQLGRTAAGRQTWLSQDLTTGEPLIIKLLAFSPQMQWQELELFEREARVLQNLDHPCIPCYRDYFSLEAETGGGLPWFALLQDYIPGNSLQELLEQGQRFSEIQVRTIAQEILEILIYLHELSPPVLHRDIKPSNLILGPDRHIYLVDFGAVQAQAAVTGVTFTVVGTSGYAPLEQFWGRAVAASDLYAMGATLIHLLTGVAPADLPHRDSRIQFSDRVSVDPQLVQWLEKMTESAVEKRFSNARQALDALHSKMVSSNASLRMRRQVEPESNSIFIWKKPDRMEIRFSGGGLVRRFQKLGLFSSRGCLLSLMFNWVVVLAVLVLLPVYSVLSLERIEVNFSQDSFEIKRRILFFVLNYQRGWTSHITGVFLNRSGSAYEVSVRADRQTYWLGGSLTEDECVWLAQQIQDWLDGK